MKTATKLAIATTGFAAMSLLDVPAGLAFGDAPWCAVISLGKGDVYWDCRYRTIEECDIADHTDDPAIPHFVTALGRRLVPIDPS